MPSIQELRDKYKGSAYDNMSDLQITQHVAEQNGQPLDVAAYHLGVELPTISSNSGAALKSGIAGYKQGYGNIAAAVGDAVGSSTLKKYGENLRDDQGIIQGYADSQNTDPTNFDDVHGLKDAAGYLRSGALKSLPYMAEALTYAAADGITGGALTPAILERYSAMAAAKFGAKGIAEEAARTGVTKEAATKAAGRGLARSIMVPVVTAPSSLGDVLGNQYTESGKYNLESALPAAAGYTALNAFGLEGAAARGLPVSLLKSRVGRVASEFGELAVSGAAQETGQEVFNQVGRMGVNPNATLTSGDALDRYKESAIMGGVLEGLPAAFHGVVSNPHAVKDKLENNQAVDLVTPEANVQPVLGVPNRPNETMIAFPDGSTGTQTQADAYIAALPEEQRVAAKATLMGMNSDTLAGTPTQEQAPSLTPDGKLTYNYISSLPEVGKLHAETRKWINKFAVNKTPQEFIDAVGHTDMTAARGKVFEAILAAHPQIEKDATAPVQDAVQPPTNVATTDTAPLTTFVAKDGNTYGIYSSQEGYGVAVKNADGEVVAETGWEANHPIKPADMYVAKPYQRLGINTVVQSYLSKRFKGYDAAKNGMLNQEGQKWADGVSRKTSEDTAPNLGTDVALPTAQSPTLNLEKINALLSPQQKAIFGVMVDAVRNNEMDGVISSDNTLQFQSIANKAGLPNRGAAQSAINRTLAKISKATGVDVKEYLAANNKATRNVESSDYDNLGLSPAKQATVLDSTAIQAANSEDGGSASMGTISSVGGSQSIGEGAGARGEVQLNEPSPPPSDNAVAAAVANRRALYRELFESPHTQQAKDDFNDYKPDNAPELQQYSLNDQADFIADYIEILDEAENKDLDSHETGKLIEDAVRLFTRDKEDNYGTIPSVPSEVIQLGERVGETENKRPLAIHAEKSTESPEPSGQNADARLPTEQNGASEQRTDSPSGRETQAVKADTGDSLVVKLQDLSNNPKYAAIAKSFLSDAMKGKDVEAQAQAWADGVTSDVTDKLDNAVNNPTVQLRTDSKYTKAGTVFVKNRRWIRNPVSEAQAKVTTPILDNIRGYGWDKAVDKISSVQAMRDKEFPADAGVELQPDGTYTLFLHPNMFEGKNADGKPHSVENSLQRTLDHEVTHIADGINRHFSGIDKPAFNPVISELEGLFSKDNIVTNLFQYPIDFKGKDGFDYRSEVLAELISAYKDSRLSKILKDNAPLAYKYAEDVSNAIRQNKRTIDQAQSATSVGRTEGSDGDRSIGQRVTSSVPSTSAYAEQAADRILEKLYGPQFRIATEGRKFAEKIAGDSGELIYDDTAHSLGKLGNSLKFLHDLVDDYKDKLPAIKDWYTSVQASMSTRRQLEGDAEAIANAANNLKGGTEALNKFISRSTYEQKWGYDPKITGKTVAVDPELRVQFNKLSVEEQKIVKDVFAHSEKMNAAKKEILTKLGIDQFFTNEGTLDGPYAPLKRFGNYVAVLKSAELRAAEKAKDKKLVEKLKASPDHYVVSNFDSIGQAKLFAKNNDVVNGGKFTMTDPFEKSERVGEARVMPADVLQKVLAAVKVDENIPATAYTAMKQLVQDMYFQSLDEHNARTSGLRRRNIAGYDADMIRSFLSQARAEAGFLANMKHGGDINEHFYNMQSTAKDLESGKHVSQNEFNTIASHYAENLKYVETPWQDRAMALTSAWQLATSLGYHVTNALQGIMVTIPKLGADFNNYTGAWDHLLKGYKVLKETGVIGQIDLSKVKDVNIRAMLQEVSNAGLLDVGLDGDLTNFESTKTGIYALDKTSSFARTALHKLRIVSRGVESANRVSSAVAAYNMAIESGKTVSEATDYALKIVRTTQGDFSRISKPLLLKRLPKVVGQYRGYQFMMASLYSRAFKQAFLNADPMEKAIGRRMLAYKLFHTAVASGVLGMPLANLVGLAFGALGDDDEPQDLERSLREAIGDEDLSDMLLHGPLAMIGLDMSAKLGEDKIFAVAPYTNIDLTSASGLAKTLAGGAGPAFSELGHIADGVGSISRGDYYKGIEKFMPKGIESGMKAFRIANDGYTLKNGDVLFSPEDINGMALALDAVGMSSSEMKHMDWIRGQDFEITHFYKDRTTAIEQAYNKAYAEGDTDAMGELRDKWQELQDGKDRVRPFFNDSNKVIKRQPLSTLMKYPQAQQKRDTELQRQNPEDSY